MKKILLSANTSWYLYNYKKDLIKTLIKKNYHVYILAKKDRYSFYLKKIGAKVLFLDIAPSSTNLFSEIKTIMSYWKNISLIKPQAVLNFTIKNNIYGSIVCNLQKISYSSNTAGFGNVYINSSFKYYIIKKIYEISLKFTNLIFCQNNEDYFYLLKSLNIQKKNICLLPGSGIKIESVNKIIKTQKLKNKFFTFLYIGRFIKNKGILDLVTAFLELKKKIFNIQLFLVGYERNNKNASNLKKKIYKISKKKNSIKIFDFTKKPFNFMLKSDCIVVPSYKEGLSKTILEAGLANKICLASNVAGCNQIIKNNKNGFLFTPGNVNELEKKMLSIFKLKNKVKKSIINKAYKNVVTNYDEALVTKKTLKHLKIK